MLADFSEVSIEALVWSKKRLAPVLETKGIGNFAEVFRTPSDFVVLARRVSIKAILFRSELRPSSVLECLGVG